MCEHIDQISGLCKFKIATWAITQLGKRILKNFQFERHVHKKH